jgi:sulfhydrogenase subunit alpha
MKTVSIHSVARVEGHCGVTVQTEGRRVRTVRVDVYEGPRLIEELVVGMKPEEAHSLTPRICAICTMSHKLASLRAFERALGVSVPPRTRLLRKLLHMGELIESNALHVFFLALPDLMGYPSVLAMAEEHPDEVRRALRLKQFGNRVMEVLSGRTIHGENPIIGGFGRSPERGELESLKKSAEGLFDDAEAGLALIGGLEPPPYGEAETIFMCLEPDEFGYGFEGDTVRLSTGETRSVEDYRALTNEYVAEHSFSKRCRYNGKPFFVGALARMNLIGERLEGRAGELFRHYYYPRWLRNPLMNNWAQAVEILFCIESMPSLIDKTLAMPDAKNPAVAKESGEATGAVEAPRGTLYHHYRIQDGIVAAADLVIPTTQNLDSMETHCRAAAEKLLAEGKEGNDLLHPLEMIVRAYDPCISCSAHAVRLEELP